MSRRRGGSGTQVHGSRPHRDSHKWTWLTLEGQTFKTLAVKCGFQPLNHKFSKTEQNVSQQRPCGEPGVRPQKPFARPRKKGRQWRQKWRSPEIPKSPPPPIFGVSGVWGCREKGDQFFDFPGPLGKLHACWPKVTCGSSAGKSSLTEGGLKGRTLGAETSRPKQAYVRI